MALSIDQFREAVERDAAALARGEAPAGTATCSCCGIPLQSEVTGRHLVGEAPEPSRPTADMAAT